MRVWKRLGILGMLFASHVPSLALAQGVQFADDFETGTLLETGPSPGKWTRTHLEGANELSAHAAAAHRGAWGYRFTDNESPATAGGEGLLNVRYPQLSGNIYTRFWMRIAPVNRAGNLHFLHVLAPGFVRSLSVSTAFDGELSLAGSNALALDEIARKQGVLLGEEWHLFEAALEGLGSATGRRQLWIDGTLALEQPGVNLSGMTASELSLGEPYTDNRSFTGTLDFDDVRISTSPPASRLRAVLSTDPAETGSCLPLRLSLQDSSGNPAAAPYAVEVEMDTGEGGGFSLDADCRETVSHAAIRESAMEEEVFVWFEKPGLFVLRASHGDFLGASVTVEVSEGQRRALDLGCDCAQGQGGTASLWGLVFLVAAAGWRGKARGRTGVQAP